MRRWRAARGLGLASPPRAPPLGSDGERCDRHASAAQVRLRSSTGDEGGVMRFGSLTKNVQRRVAGYGPALLATLAAGAYALTNFGGFLTLTVVATVIAAWPSVS